MYIWINDKYSSTSFKKRLCREKWFWYNQINSSNKYVWQCGAAVKELLAAADEPGSTPGNTAFSVSLYRFFSFFFCLVFVF